MPVEVAVPAEPVTPAEPGGPAGLAPSAERNPLMRWKTGGLAVLLTAGACAVVAPPAYADHYRNGNGTGNRNAFSIRSPTRNHGVMVVSNANAGGVSVIRNALCKRQRICAVHQNG